ncbi:hypothetical protein AWB68_00685 [Caballeronia choica]|uniref:Uncharacterized protein n=1 Tax=Caballeronia choica TaxID=326476 RepID=A0A158FJH0_9BURK|nr:hypothetical protein [Caballeronia choica]SAL19783.1 hypothetical protein AWB68_00685 [Caballeronia choica]
MILSPNWAKAHKRYSVWALAASTALQVLWAAVQDPPLWAVLLANGVIGGLVIAYLAQPSVTGESDADASE